jgi:hypothetical protein
VTEEDVTQSVKTCQARDTVKLATRPISVTPPAGWSDSITHSGASDGYGILFTANTSASYVQPGGNAVAVLRRSGVVISAISFARSNVGPSFKAETADALLERGELMGVMPFDLASTSPRTNHSHQA